MKKFISILVVLAILFGSGISILTMNAFASADKVTPIVTAKLNNITVTRIYDIFKALGAAVTYDGKSKTFTVVKGSTRIILKDKEMYATVNGVKVKLEAAVIVDSNNTGWVPFSFVIANSSKFGYTLEFDTKSKSYILKKILSRITVSPGTMTIEEGKSQTIKISAVYMDGTVQDITLQSVVASQNAGIAVVKKDNSQVSIAGLKCGNTLVTVAYKNFKSNISVTVKINESEYGNNLGNIPSNGTAVFKKGYTYFANPLDNNIIYIINPNGTITKNPANEKGGYLNVIGDWIYYTNPDDNNSIYKIRTDFKDRKKLIYSGAKSVMVQGSWIYYVNTTDGSCIYRMKTDGTYIQKLSGDLCISLNTAYGWIFYINQGDGSRIYKMKTDGTSRQKVCEDITTQMNIYDGWIYYINFSDGQKIYKIKVDGTGKTRISEDATSCINVYAGYIYYTNCNGDNKLYRIRINGTVKEKMNDDITNYINTADKWIYYSNYGENGLQFYRVSLDGKKRQILSDMTFK